MKTLNTKLSAKKTISLLLSSALVLSTQSLFAESSEKKSENQLERVQVIGSKLGQEVKDLPVATMIYTQADIEASTASSLGGFLKTVPGINVRSLYGNADTGATVDMRGFGASSVNNTLILLDGQRLNDVDIAAIDLSALPLQFIERIEVLPGSGSVLYGNGASGGSINIVTKTSFDKNIYIGATIAKYKEPGKIDIAAGYNTENTANLVAISGQEADGYRENNELKQQNILVKSTYFLDDDTLAFATFTADDQDLEFPGERRFNTDPDFDPSTDDAIDEISSDPQGSGTLNDWGKKFGISLQLGVQKEFAEDNELGVTLGYRAKNQEAFFDDYSGFGYTNYSDADLASFSFRPYYRGKFFSGDIKNSFQVGLDFYSTSYETERSLNEASSATPVHIVAIDQDLVAFYGQNISDLTKKLKMTLGLRTESLETEGSDIYDSTAPAAPFTTDAQAAPFDERDRENVYMAGLRYQINSQVNVFARSESSVRFGTVDETFELKFTPAFVGFSVLAPLEPQTGVVNEVGVESQFDNSSFLIAMYQADYENEIHFDPITFDNLNLDDTRRSGLNIRWHYQAFEKFEIDANANFTKAEFSAGANKGNRIPLVPQQNYHLAFTWGFYQNFALASSTRFVGASHFDNDQANTFVAQIPSYTMSDLKVSWQKEELKCALTVFNVFNEEGAISYGVASTSGAYVYNAYPLPDQHAQFSVSYAF